MRTRFRNIFLIISLFLLVSCSDFFMHIVSFDPNGGSFKSSISVRVFDGNTIDKPDDPVLEGYNFDGWYLRSSATAYDFSTPVTSDITLVARWVKEGKTYNVKYYGSVDGTLDESIKVPAQLTIKAGESISEPETPIFDESKYLFKGWSTSPVEYKEISFPCQVNSDMELYAFFESIKTFTITYHAVLNGSIDDSITVPESVNVNSGYQITSIPNPSSYDEGSNIFVAWSTSRSSLEPVTLPYTVSADTELYAIIGSRTGKTGKYGELTYSYDSSTEGYSITKFTSPSDYSMYVLPFEIPSTVNLIPVTAIGDRAFENSNVTKILFKAPSYVKKIGDYAFYNSSLFEMDTEGSVPPQEYYVYFNTLPASVETIGAYAFSSNPLRGSIIIPNGVTIIAHHAFQNLNYTCFVTIPSTTKVIGDYAFENSPMLQAVVTSEGILSIGSYAFANCPILQNADLSSSIVYMGSRVFDGDNYDMMMISTHNANKSAWATDWNAGTSATIYSNN